MAPSRIDSCFHDRQTLILRTKLLVQKLRVITDFAFDDAPKNVDDKGDYREREGRLHLL
jgi:hypothetical protein